MSAPVNRHYHQILNPKACNCNLESKKRLIHRIPFLRAGSAKTMEILCRNLRNLNLPESGEVNYPYDETGIFGIVARGAFKVVRQFNDGQAIIYDVLTAGDFFLYGLAEQDSIQMFCYPDTIQSMTNSCILVMDRQRLQPILQNDPHILPDFLNQLTSRLRQNAERFIRFMAFDASHRLAYLLQFLYQKGHIYQVQHGLIPFHLTRKDLAAMTGLTLETVSRILSAWARDGLIRSGRSWVEILDFPRIEQACRPFA